MNKRVLIVLKNGTTCSIFAKRRFVGPVHIQFFNADGKQVGIFKLKDIEDIIVYSR